MQSSWPSVSRTNSYRVHAQCQQQELMQSSGPSVIISQEQLQRSGPSVISQEQLQRSGASVISQEQLQRSGPVSSVARNSYSVQGPVS